MHRDRCRWSKRSPQQFYELCTCFLQISNRVLYVLFTHVQELFGTVVLKQVTRPLRWSNMATMPTLPETQAGIKEEIRRQVCTWPLPCSDPTLSLPVLEPASVLATWTLAPWVVWFPRAFLHLLVLCSPGDGAQAWWKLSASPTELGPVLGMRSSWHVFQLTLIHTT